jgi:hypothetical protein
VRLRASNPVRPTQPRSGISAGSSRSERINPALSARKYNGTPHGLVLLSG